MSTMKNESAAGPGGLCTKEIREIPIVAYRDSNGAPACCVDWNTARCKFVSTQRSGVFEVCSATGLDLWRLPADPPPDKRRKNYHLLRPVAGCPVWGDEV